MKNMDYSVAIIGAGASGLMCAIEAAKRNKTVIVLDHNRSIGSKIAISGGGRCNFTNLDCQSQHYISENPHFVKSALSGFRPQNFISMLDKYNIGYEEKKSGQLFCKRSSQDIIHMLMKECEAYGVEILCDTKVISVKRDKLFEIKTNDGEIKSSSLVVATGGISYPKLGATDLGFKIAREFKIKVTKLRPALVPLLFESKDRKVFSQLSGVSLKARVSLEKVAFTDDMLFTHKGLSGPAILQISS
ncbi:MAG: aminoacetone oxidase family FAD-binding enzyme, partial [Pseudomonadota bacterium]